MVLRVVKWEESNEGNRREGRRESATHSFTDLTLMADGGGGAKFIRGWSHMTLVTCPSRDDAFRGRGTVVVESRQQEKEVTKSAAVVADKGSVCKSMVIVAHSLHEAGFLVFRTSARD